MLYYIMFIALGLLLVSQVLLNLTEDHFDKERAMKYTIMALITLCLFCVSEAKARNFDSNGSLLKTERTHTKRDSMYVMNLGENKIWASSKKDGSHTFFTHRQSKKSGKIYRSYFSKKDTIAGKPAYEFFESNLKKK